QEVPEIYDGVVEIMSIAREAGDRSKLAVFSHVENVDAVGTCVGPKGVRVQAIVNELNGENMDIVEWDEDPVVFIKNALNPSEVIDVYIDEEERECVAVVPDLQLSLAIGRRGQNVRLAARLTGYKIDIKSESDFDPEEYAHLEAEKDITEDSEENEVSSDLSIEPILDESEDFFDSLEDMSEDADPDEVEDTEDFCDIFDDQQDEDSPIETKALETDEDTPREDNQVSEMLEDEYSDSEQGLSTEDENELADLDEELDEIDEELDEQE